MNLFKSLLKLIIFLNLDKKVLNNYKNHVKDKNNLLSQSKSINKKSKDLDNNNNKGKKFNSKKKDKKLNNFSNKKNKKEKNKFCLISKKYKPVWSKDKFNTKDLHKKLNNL